MKYAVFVGTKFLGAAEAQTDTEVLDQAVRRWPYYCRSEFVVQSDDSAKAERQRFEHDIDRMSYDLPRR